MKKWTTYQTLGELPTNPGVYVIYGNGKLLYIGSSQNIRGRMVGHLKETKYGFGTRWGCTYTQVTIKTRILFQRQYQYLTLEAQLINRLKPIHNFMLNSQKKRRHRPSFNVYDDASMLR